MCVVIVGSLNKGFPGGSDSKASACNTEDLGLIPGLQYSCLENRMDGGAW